MKVICATANAIAVLLNWFNLVSSVYDGYIFYVAASASQRTLNLLLGFENRQRNLRMRLGIVNRSRLYFFVAIEHWLGLPVLDRSVNSFCFQPISGAIVKFINATHVISIGEHEILPARPAKP